MLNHFFLCTLFSFFLSFSLNAQSPAPCSSEGHRQFDFWIGEWEVFDTAGDTMVGHSLIKNILNDCVIEENWTGGSGFAGKSFNTYNEMDSTWNQVWVDQSGATYHFSGKYKDQVMALKGQSKTNRGTALFTLTFSYNQEANTIRQVWKLSKDQGITWENLFDGTYRRKE